MFTELQAPPEHYAKLIICFYKNLSTVLYDDDEMNIEWKMNARQ